MMDRVGDPQLSPDGRYALFSVRATDYAANKGVTSIYVVDLNKPPQPVMVVEKGSSPALGTGWQVHLLLSAEGRHGPGLASLVRRRYLGQGPWPFGPHGRPGDGRASGCQRIQALAGWFQAAAELRRVHRLRRSGLHEGTPRTGAKSDKSTGTVYNKLFVRHWDTWADGRRSQLYIAAATRRRSRYC